ncbi:hypothetical protein HMPREF1565_0657 [Providencia alcalifaciens RIMD 1656011]|uniref:Uncharacterized protein n=1 Tax=Providencia alcalifaciens 205/92 TaxID=1256988 RepID=A0AAV3M7L0_9GAMM|nr:hypothetical protein HMPREF1565_0657 [Providencia alcalifaciens RIMD 1656011]EUD11730.1 hypothetical protein HMPREF1563_0307 [Providencia alcalifaciens 205/92]WGZ56280.1 hypothetical protein PO864_19950 [Providencia alcalifaciens]
MQVVLSFLIFLAPIIDLLFDGFFSKINTVLFVLAWAEVFYFFGAIILFFVKKENSLQKKEILEKIFIKTT